MSLEKFQEEYAKQLRIAVEKYPQEYSWAYTATVTDKAQPEVEDAVNKVVKKMSNAFATRTYSNHGHAIKATCKALGIAHTYKAINEYNKPRGCLSSPIHQETMEEAREVLSRTYTSDRFELVPRHNIDYGEQIMFGAHKAWVFEIVSKKSKCHCGNDTAPGFDECLSCEMARKGSGR